MHLQFVECGGVGRPPADQTLKLFRVRGASVIKIPAALEPFQCLGRHTVKAFSRPRRLGNQNAGVGRTITHAVHSVHFDLTPAARPAVTAGSRSARLGFLKSRAARTVSFANRRMRLDVKPVVRPAVKALSRSGRLENSSSRLWSNKLICRSSNAVGRGARRQTKSSSLFALRCLARRHCAAHCQRFRVHEASTSPMGCRGTACHVIPKASSNLAKLSPR